MLFPPAMCIGNESHVTGKYGDPGCAWRPVRVRDGPLTPLKPGYLAGREDNEHTAARKVLEPCGHSPPVSPLLADGDQ